MTRPHLSSFAVLAGALATVALSACGGGGGNQATASESSGEASSVRFAKCLREHGIEASTSGSGGPGVLVKGNARAGGPQQMEAAQKACARYQPNGGKAPKRSPAEQAQFADEALAFARCMRAHGIDVPNPEVSGGHVSIRIHGGPGTGPESPKFQAAQKACQGLMPKPPGGAQGGGAEQRAGG